MGPDQNSFCNVIKKYTYLKGLCFTQLVFRFHVWRQCTSESHSVSGGNVQSNWKAAGLVDLEIGNYEGHFHENLHSSPLMSYFGTQRPSDPIKAEVPFLLCSKPFRGTHLRRVKAMRQQGSLFVCSVSSLKKVQSQKYGLCDINKADSVGEGLWQVSFKAAEIKNGYSQLGSVSEMSYLTI